jgi:hypothetical protein
VTLIFAHPVDVACAERILDFEPPDGPEPDERR